MPALTRKKTNAAAYAQPNARNRRSASSRKSAQSPGIQTSALTGLCRNSWPGMNSGCSSLPVRAFMLRENSRNGQSCCTWNQRNGSAPIAASPRPASSQRDRRYRRAGVSSSPMASAASHTTIVDFESNPKPGRCADPDPPARVSGAQQSNQEERDGDPGEQIEARRLEPVVDGQERRIEGDAQRRDHLRGATAAELAGDQRREHHGRDPEERRHESEPGERRSDDEVDGPRHPGHEERVIDVADVEVTTTHEVVELVAVPAVAGEERELQRELHPGDDQHRDGGEPGQCAARRGALAAPPVVPFSRTLAVIGQPPAPARRRPCRAPSAAATSSLIIEESLSSWRCHANQATVSMR